MEYDRTNHKNYKRSDNIELFFSVISNMQAKYRLNRGQITYICGTKHRVANKLQILKYCYRSSSEFSMEDFDWLRCGMAY